MARLRRALAEALARRALTFVPDRAKAIRAPVRGREPLVCDFRFRPVEAAHSKREQNRVLVAACAPPNQGLNDRSNDSRLMVPIVS
jgi:hypothetical protein